MNPPGWIRHPKTLRLLSAFFVVVAVGFLVRGWSDPSVPSPSGYLGIAFGLAAMARAEEAATGGRATEERAS